MVGGGGSSDQFTLSVELVLHDVTWLRPHHPAPPRALVVCCKLLGLPVTSFETAHDSDLHSTRLTFNQARCCVLPNCNLQWLHDRLCKSRLQCLLVEPSSSLAPAALVAFGSFPLHAALADLPARDTEPLLIARRGMAFVRDVGGRRVASVRFLLCIGRCWHVARAGCKTASHVTTGVNESHEPGDGEIRCRPSRDRHRRSSSESTRTQHRRRRSVSPCFSPPPRAHSVVDPRSRSEEHVQRMISVSERLSRGLPVHEPLSLSHTLSANKLPYSLTRAARLRLAPHVHHLREQLVAERAATRRHLHVVRARAATVTRHPRAAATSIRRLTRLTQGEVPQHVSHHSHTQPSDSDGDTAILGRDAASTSCDHEHARAGSLQVASSSGISHQTASSSRTSSALVTDNYDDSKSSLAHPPFTSTTSATSTSTILTSKTSTSTNTSTILTSKTSTSTNTSTSVTLNTSTLKNTPTTSTNTSATSTSTSTSTNTSTTSTNTPTPTNTSTTSSGTSTSTNTPTSVTLNTSTLKNTPTSVTLNTSTILTSKTSTPTNTSTTSSSTSTSTNTPTSVTLNTSTILTSKTSTPTNTSTTPTNTSTTSTNTPTSVTSKTSTSKRSSVVTRYSSSQVNEACSVPAATTTLSSSSSGTVEHTQDRYSQCSFDSDSESVAAHSSRESPVSDDSSSHDATPSWSHVYDVQDLVQVAAVTDKHSVSDVSQGSGTSQRVAALLRSAGVATLLPSARHSPNTDSVSSYAPSDMEHELSF